MMKPGDTEMGTNPLRGGNPSNVDGSTESLLGSIQRTNKAEEGKKTFGFALTADLENGSLALSADEKVVWDWCFNSELMSSFEWLATFLTLGFYYIYTRVIFRRRRHFHIIVTNQRYIVKEELFIRKGVCSAEIQVSENQMSYSHRQLVYACLDINRTLAASASVTLRFGQFPDWLDIPLDNYESAISFLFRWLKEPVKRAFNKVYKIDLDAPPMKRMKQMVDAAQQSFDPSSLIQFGITVVTECFKELFMAIFAAFSDNGVDPSIGPRQVHGEYPVTKFELHCTTLDDPKVFERVSELQALISKYTFEDANIDIKSGTTGSKKSTKEQNNVRYMNHVYGKDCVKQQLANNIVMWDEGILPVLTKEQTLVNVLNHPYLTTRNIIQIIMTFGSYYFAELSSRLNHREFFVLTNRRLIRFWQLKASYSNESNGGYTHYRVDYWRLPKQPNPNGLYNILPASNAEIRVAFNSGAHGLLTFPIRSKHKEGIFELLHILTDQLPCYPAVSPALPPIQAANAIQATLIKLFGGHFNAAFTPILLKKQIEKEWIEINPLTGKLPDGSCLSFFQLTTHHNFLILTNRGIYVEERMMAYGCMEKCHTLCFYPWATLQTVYWANYNRQIQCCSVCCCGCCKLPDGCPEIKCVAGCIPYGCGAHVDPLHGFCGVIVKLVVTGQANGLVHAVGLPFRYFGNVLHQTDEDVDRTILFLNHCAAKRGVFTNMVQTTAHHHDKQHMERAEGSSGGTGTGGGGGGHMNVSALMGEAKGLLQDDHVMSEVDSIKDKLEEIF